jgi:hypothetical protein
MDQTWLEKLKTYAAEVILRKVGPAAGASLLSLLAAAIAAHQQILETFGVNYIASWSPAWLSTHDISGHVILVELDTTGTAVWAIIGAAAVGLIVAGGHHVTAAVTGAPQTGGQRATDQ